jgi:hypothetical protein
MSVAKFLVMHPLWFDIMGAALFLCGWGLTVIMSREQAVGREEKE